MRRGQAGQGLPRGVNQRKRRFKIDLTSTNKKRSKKTNSQRDQELLHFQYSEKTKKSKNQLKNQNQRKSPKTRFSKAL